MPKRNFVVAFVLLAALAASCLFAAGIAAQKGLHGSSAKASQHSLTNTTLATTTVTVPGAPVGGCDIKLGKNPGGNAAARTTNANGIIDLSDLAPGSYWMAVQPLSNATKAANPDLADYSYIAVTITGNTLVGKTKARSLDVNKWKYVNARPKDATARTADTYADRIEFEIGPTKGGLPPSTNTTIIKSKSNICSN